MYKVLPAVLHTSSVPELLVLMVGYTDKKEKKIFLIVKKIQMGAVEKSYMRKGFLINEEIRKYLVKYEEAVSHIGLCNRSLLDFPMYEENFVFFFISVVYVDYCVMCTVHKLTFKAFTHKAQS